MRADRMSRNSSSSQQIMPVIEDLPRAWIRRWRCARNKGDCPQMPGAAVYLTIR